MVGCMSAVKKDLSKNVLVYRFGAQPDGLHPTNDNSAMRTNIFHYIHGTPVKLDIRTLELIPFYTDSLAKVSADKLKYDYLLRADARWDNGEPLRAEDVAFSVKMMLNPFSDNSQMRNFYSTVIKSIETNPENPLWFRMTAHDLHFNNISILSGIYLQQKSLVDPDGVMDNISFAQLFEENFKTSAAAKDERFRKFMKRYNDHEMRYVPANLRGIGPYKVADWTPGKSIILEKKKNWWGDKDTSMFNANNVEKIIFKIVSDEAPAYLGIKKQEIDATNSLSTIKLIKLQKYDYFNENYFSDFLDQFSYSYIGLNCRPDGIKHKKYFTDKKVRRAMAHLTPVDQIIKILVHGKAMRITTLVNPRMPEFDKSLVPIELDVEKAKELLAEAGWADTDGDNILDKEVDGERLQMNIEFSYMTGSNTTKQIVLMIKESWYKAGINLIPKPLEFTTFYDRAQKHDFDAMMGGWSGSGEWQDFTQIWSQESWASKGSNFTGFGNAYTDGLIKRINRKLTLEERMPLSQEMQRLVYEEQPYIFMYSVKRKVLVHKRFIGGRGYAERPGIFVSNLILDPSYAGSPAAPEKP